MGIIKSNNAPVSVTPYSLRDIEQQAAAIVLRAQQQVDQMLAKARTEGDQIRQRAYDQGFAAGQEDGLRKGTEDGRAAAGKQAATAEQRAKLEQLIKTLMAAVADLESSRQKLESAAATEVIKLAVAIARRVTKLQGTLEPNVLTENIRAAMKLVIHSTDVRIGVNPTQTTLLNELLPQLRMQWPNLKHVELVDDPSITVGGCRVFTASGDIDADLERQIDRVANELLPGAQGAAA